MKLDNKTPGKFGLFYSRYCFVLNQWMGRRSFTFIPFFVYGGRQVQKQRILVFLFFVIHFTKKSSSLSRNGKRRMYFRSTQKKNFEIFIDVLEPFVFFVLFPPKELKRQSAQKKCKNLCLCCFFFLSPSWLASKCLKTLLSPSVFKKKFGKPIIHTKHKKWKFTKKKS